MRALAFVPILALFAAAPLRAGDEGPCRADKERFCKDVEPGEGRIVKCMAEHEAELSEACRAVIRRETAEFKKHKMKEKAKELRHELHEACQADKERLCKDVEPGEGRIMKCMKEHEAELSEACRKQGLMMKERHEKMKAFQEKSEACKADKERLCKGVEPGEGRIVKCMKEHEKELSEACRAMMGKMHGRKKDKPAKEETKD